MHRFLLVTLCTIKGQEKIIKATNPIIYKIILIRLTTVF